MNISHWEIWNEPENSPDPETNPCWKGTWEKYLDFYGIAATYLKSKFPELKIGGYGSCGFYSVTGDSVAAGNNSMRYDNFVTCFHSFLKKARSEGWPLDFFSAHSYSCTANAIKQMQYARKTLDEYGFKKTELSVNE